MSQTRLFVGNLPNNIKEDDLRTVFSTYGQVTNLDIKYKPGAENESSKFAFVTISSANTEVEACIRHFSNSDFKGSKLYVTRARESFLERLQRERQQNEQKEAEKKNHKEPSKHHPVIKLGDRLNPRKRKNDTNENGIQPANNFKELKVDHKQKIHKAPGDGVQTHGQNISAADEKKLESEKKRIESMQKKRQEFKNKQQIIKTGLISVDKTPNKKLRFSDIEDEPLQVFTDTHSKPKLQKKNTLFDDDESDEEVNFEIKKQYEGKKGQKVLDLQSRYKSDKRFVLDERFIEDEQSEDETKENQDGDQSEAVDVTQGDEKSTQIKILEDVLGVAIKSHTSKADKDRKVKPSMGMIRFDPMNPEHAKFVVPIEEVKHEPKKSKKKLKELSESAEPPLAAPKVEVSKEQFYKSEITKEAFEQPAGGFSLRSLFARDDSVSKDEQPEAEATIQPQKKQKVKNPLDPGEKNPFVYDSSESEDEAEGVEKNPNTIKDLPEVPEVKAVWKENLFFSKDDSRLKVSRPQGHFYMSESTGISQEETIVEKKAETNSTAMHFCLSDNPLPDNYFINSTPAVCEDGLAFFNNIRPNEVQKERRELKSVMKKRIHNTERKNQMFKKKIGGRKKSMKKSYKKKS